MKENLLRSKVTLDKHTSPLLYEEIAKVPHRYRASRLLALAAMGLVLEKMQDAGGQIRSGATQKSDEQRNDSEVAKPGADSHPDTATIAIEELGMGDLFSASECGVVEMQ